jgi:hypothetical protein
MMSVSKTVRWGGGTVEEEAEQPNTLPTQAWGCCLQHQEQIGGTIEKNIVHVDRPGPQCAHLHSGAKMSRLKAVIEMAL